MEEQPLHHIVIHDGERVNRIIYDVKDIEVDLDKKVIRFEDGKIVGLDHEHFLIVDDEVPVFVGQAVDEHLRGHDETENFEKFDFFREIKEFFTGEND